MGTVSKHAARKELIHRLDSAVDAKSDKVRCENVKSVLQHIVERGDQLVDEKYLKSSEDHYARHLLHRDPSGRYSVLVMVWAPGQGTPLHDHNGKWCVECVYRGQTRVRSYEKTGEDGEENVVYFEHRGEVVSGFGDAGALIPPYEYHELLNNSDQKTVTLHVYDQELLECNAYYPINGRSGAYRREHKELFYTSEIPSQSGG